MSKRKMMLENYIKNDITNEKTEGSSMKNELESCREKIIEEIQNIHNIWILRQIWLTIQNIK